MDLYTQKYIDLVSLAVLVFAGLCVGLKGFFGVDIFRFIEKQLGFFVITTMYALIGLSAIVHLFSRDYYLPFLGDSAYPCGSLMQKTPDRADTEVLVSTYPNTSVIYWASESNKEVQPNPWMAYAENTNAGVTRSDERGKTVLKVRKPSSYRTPSGRLLKPHIHYRVCEGKGMLGRVQTVFLA